MSTQLYVVTGRPIDLAKVALPPYISAQCPTIGRPTVCFLHCHGVAVEDGYEAIKEVYPEAQSTTIAETAGKMVVTPPPTKPERIRAAITSNNND